MDERRVHATELMSHGVKIARLVLAPVAVVLFLLSYVAVCWGVAKTTALVHSLVWEDAWQSTASIAKFVSILDVLLVGMTIFVVGLGVWQLFVGHLELPRWLQFEELRSLKVVVADLLVLTLTVGLIEDFLLDGARDSFWLEALGVGIVNLTLIAFASLRSDRA